MELLKPNELAQMLAVSRAWVYEAATSGRIPSVRIGGEGGPLRFVPDDIDRWLEDARAGWMPVASSPIRRTSAEPRERRPRSRRDAADEGRGSAVIAIAPASRRGRSPPRSQPRPPR